MKVTSFYVYALSVLAVYTSIVVSQSDSSTPLSSSDCSADLILCSVTNPVSIADIYQTRICLWSNKDFVSDQCKTFLTTTSPSIVEPCLYEIQTYCSGVSPGFGQVHNCLTARPNDLSLGCSTAIVADNSRDTSDIMRSALETNNEMERSNVPDTNLVLTFITDVAHSSTSSEMLSYYRTVISDIWNQFADIIDTSDSPVIDIHFTEDDSDDKSSQNFGEKVDEGEDSPSFSSSFPSSSADMDMFSVDEFHTVQQQQIAEDSQINNSDQPLVYSVFGIEIPNFNFFDSSSSDSEAAAVVDYSNPTHLRSISRR